jgi:hypothetical protein
MDESAPIKRNQKEEKNVESAGRTTLTGVQGGRKASEENDQNCKAENGGQASF